MIRRIFLGFALLAAIPLWSQVEPSATGGAMAPDDDDQMSMPPQVSGKAYPMTVGSEARTNFLAGGLLVTAAYDDNVLAGGTAKPVSDTTYTISPTISVTRETPRQNDSISYSTGFTFYQHTTAYNEVNQSATVDLGYRMSLRCMVGLQDSFQQNSSAFSQPSTISEQPVSGSTLAPSVYLIVPFASQIINSTQGEIGYQLGRNSMVGGAGSYGLFHYPDLDQVPGLNDSTSAGGLGFYSLRLTRGQYFGAIYQYSRVTTNPVDTTTQMHTGAVFYTILPSRKFSLSITAGPEYVETAIPAAPSTSSIGSVVKGSFGWRGSRASAAASYSRSVTAGQGLLGAYKSNTANASMRWRIKRNWTAEGSGVYGVFTNIDPLLESNPGGHTVLGETSIEHPMGEHLTADLGYRRLHQRYSGIEAISATPDDNRVSVSFQYEFTRPLGR